MLVCSLSCQPHSGTVPLWAWGVSSRQAITSHFIHIFASDRKHKICSALCCYLRTACCVHPAQSSPVPLAASPGVSVTSRGSRLAPCWASAHSPQPGHAATAAAASPVHRSEGEKLFLQREAELQKHHLRIAPAKSALAFGSEKYSAGSVKHSGGKISGWNPGQGRTCWGHYQAQLSAEMGNALLTQVLAPRQQRKGHGHHEKAVKVSFREQLRKGGSSIKQRTRKGPRLLTEPQSTSSFRWATSTQVSRYN